jgi:hypothetical protein
MKAGPARRRSGERQCAPDVVSNSFTSGRDGTFFWFFPEFSRYTTQ